MADPSTPPNDPEAPSDGHREPPAYDLDKEGYTGISAGTLHSVQGLHDARDFAEMIVDTIREGLLVLDFDLRVQAANESFYDAFRVKPEETVGRLVYDLGDGQWDLPELRELLEDILPHEKSFNDYEVEYAFEGTGERVMLLNARRLDEHQLILLAIEDVTERRKGERELRELNETLEARVEERTREVREQERRVRELSRALALAEQEERRRIAHVLHDDLQQILSDARLAISTDDTEGLGRALDEAFALTRTLSHSLSPPVLEGEDVGDLLRWVAERQQEQYDLEVEVKVGNVPVPDPFLRVLLFQVVRELLFNVAKHAGTGRARLVAERVDGDVRVVVQDTGAGFDPAELAKPSAVGLGLPNVRERVELVGGRLDVNSAPGEGTRVTILVPAEADGSGR